MIRLKTLSLAMSGATLLTLAACGGGDDTTPSSHSSSQSSARPALISWNGSASGPWIYTGNNGVIAFTASGNILYDYDTGTTNSLVTVKDGKVYLGGTQIASIQLRKNGNNQDVAVAVCLNGQYAQRVPLGNSSSLVCNTGSTGNSPSTGSSGGSGSTSGSGSSGSGGGTSSSGIPQWVPEAARMKCVDLINTSTGGNRWQNKCNEIVEVRFCVSYSDGTKSGCTSSSVVKGESVYNAAGLFQIPPNSTYPFVHGKAGTTANIRFGACAHDYYPELFVSGGFNCNNFFNKTKSTADVELINVDDSMFGFGIIQISE